MSEETGLNDLEYVQLDPKNPNLPLDIDTHYIPPSPKREEAEHYHYDFRYCFVAKDIENLNLQTSEVTEYKWVNIEEMVLSENLGRSIKKIQRFILKPSSLK